jgi:nitrogen-specific signal transduction histidine kinase
MHNPPARRPVASETLTGGTANPALESVAAQPASAAPTDDRFFRCVVSSMRSAVIAIHRDGRLALMNDEAYRIFSLERQPDDVGRPFAELFSTRVDLLRLLTGAFELASLPNRAELRLTEFNRVIGHTMSQVKDDQDQVIGAVLFFKDLTRVEQIEDRERLRDRLAALGEMAAGIAHELKNPLAAIAVEAGLLRRQVPDSVDAQSLLADIISESKLANAIVMQMLEFVRPIRLQVDRNDVRELFHQAITLAESKVPRGDIEVVIDIAPDLPLVDADEHQLVQVFTNLLIYAFEALGEQGRILIKAVVETIELDPAFATDGQAPTPTLIVDVSDNGPGVLPELSDRIFDPFFTTKPEGSGLGLPIVRKIVDAHDGRIDLTSTPGLGTRFRVTLPVSNATSWFKKT